MNQLLTNLNRSTTQLINAHTNHHDAHQALNNAKRALATLENTLTAQGLEGKNEAARKAELANKCTTEQTAVDHAEDNLRTAQLNLTIAELEYRFDREAATFGRAELLATTNHDN